MWIQIDIWLGSFGGKSIFEAHNFQMVALSCGVQLVKSGSATGQAGRWACLPLFDKQIVDPKFGVQWVVAVARFVNSSHLTASHDSYYL